MRLTQRVEMEKAWSTRLLRLLRGREEAVPRARDQVHIPEAMGDCPSLCYAHEGQEIQLQPLVGSRSL